MHSVRQTVVDGTVPSWVARLTDDDLDNDLGPDTVERGLAYHRSGAVTSLTVGRAGQVLLAGVQGSRGRRYHTIVTLEDDPSDDDPEDQLDWTSRCSCPMQVDCKHVAAVILTARSRLDGGSRPGARASCWEAALAELVREPPPASDSTPLALHLEVVTANPRAYAGSTPRSPTLRLRPVAVGKNGGWVRTGASWRELEYGYGAGRFDRAQREALLDLLSTARMRDRRVSYSSEQHLTADQLGPVLWRLLHEVGQAGVTLVTGTKGQTPVQLAEDPATVVLDVRQTGPAGDVRVSPSLRVPGTEDTGPTREVEVGYLGTPPFGVALHGPGRLTLARFDPPLDASTGKLVTGVEFLLVPAADVPRFLGLYYPVLRQRASVESSDESITFPEVQPPRLGLALRFEPEHQALLTWSFAYAVGDQTLTVPVRGSGQGPSRDRVAEAALLASLGVLDAVPGLRVGVGPERRLVPEQRLRGIDTATFVGEVLPALSATTSQSPWRARRCRTPRSRSPR